MGLSTLAVAAAVFLPVAATAQIDTGVTVAVDPASDEVVLGDSFEISVAVANTADAPTPPLAIHIDITDPASDGSVDPEDWTSTLTKSLGAVDPGTARTLTWTLQPISAGRYSIYAVALSSGGDDGALSNIATVTVDDQRSLDPGGILPVAIAMPSVIGGLLLFRLRRRGARSDLPAGV